MQCIDKNRIFDLKGTCIRVLLISGAFLLLLSGTRSQYAFNSNCQQAYRSILGLKFSEAQKLLALEKLNDETNLIPLYLENYIDFLTLFISEERAGYDRLIKNKSLRINALEKGNRNSPYYNFCLAAVNLQWALARLKFGDYTSAAFEIRKAHALFTENEKLYPGFKLNKTGLGVVHVVVGIIPENYQWIVNLMGVDGSLDQGFEEIRGVADYDGTDQMVQMFAPEALFYLAFLSANFQKNKGDALSVLSQFADQPGDDQLLHSPLLIFARAAILMKNGRNDEALNVLQERNALTQRFPLFYLDYMEGMARLNMLDYSGSICFERFLNHFKGQNYIRSAFQKRAWISILQGDTVNFTHFMHQAELNGVSVTDEDKQAYREATSGMLPNLMLLRARLLFDGGYYDLALDELLASPVQMIIRTKRDLVEYTYRLARVYHESGNPSKAMEYYQLTIGRGKNEPGYFAAASAFQLGQLYENREDFINAEKAYHLCLSIKTPEYKTSLDEKARAGINRVEKKKPKI